PSPPRRSTATSTSGGCAASMTAPIRDPELEAFLALLAARRSPRTVDAYRRDLLRLAASAGKPLREATVADLERHGAELRAEGLAAATIARRAAAARSFFRHLQLLGVRDDNPAAEAPAADALGRRGRAPDRRRVGKRPAGAARPRARGAPLRRRAARLRGGRARQGGGRPRRPARPRHGQGRQGADRPDRAPRRRGAPALPRARPPLPRPPAPARALP